MKKEIENKVKREYAEVKKTTAILDKAKALLDQYGTSDNIPLEEFNPQKTGIDDATLLAFSSLLWNNWKWAERRKGIS